MAMALETLELGKNQDPDRRSQIPFPERALPPFIGVPDLFPQKHLGGKGYHIATKEEAGCMIKVELMDAVHGRSGVTKAEKPPSSQDGALALRGLVVYPTVTSSLERSGRRSPYHRNGKSCISFAWHCFVDCFIHENGNNSADITARCHALDSAEDAEPMCALSRRQSWLHEKGTPQGWRPRRAFGLSPSRGEVPCRGKILGEARQAWRAWSLAKSSEGCCGPWQAGPWYPGFHCADTIFYKLKRTINQSSKKKAVRYQGWKNEVIFNSFIS